MNIAKKKEQTMDRVAFQRAFPAWLEEIREKLKEHGKRWEAQGLPMISCEGKLLRPFVAFCVAGALDPTLLEEERFWDAVLAVQMVHEASLLHDDIIDRAEKRRGKPTALAKYGTAAALVQGDHLLTAAYRLIAGAENVALFSRFTEAVEQTVAGELAQAKSCGGPIPSYEYSSIIAQKSGALFGFSMAIAPLLLNEKSAKALWLCGVRLGCQYQRLDDLLDYCHESETGKPVFQDFWQQKPTWPWLSMFPEDTEATWELTTDEVRHRLFGKPCAEDESAASLGMTLCLQFAEMSEQLCDDIEHHLSQPYGPLYGLLSDWTGRAQAAIAVEEEAVSGDELSGLDLSIVCAKKPADDGVSVLVQDSTPLPVSDAVVQRLRELMAEEGLADPARWPAYFASKSKSFSFAARWFPPEAQAQIAGVYAYCRCSDEIADGFGDLSRDERSALLDAWEAMTIQAYGGKTTEIPLLDVVMPSMAAQGVPVHVALDLIEGMRKDLIGEPIDNVDQLLHYCYCAASTVGLWCTHLFADPQPWVLERADALGKAMQLTNILRDVGEDLDAGRVYLPKDLMRSHGLSIDTLRQMRRGELPIVQRYVDLIEGLMKEAEELYEQAFVGMTALPDFFARPVAVAAEVYRGIHREIRRNGYNNLTKRAYTSTLRKLLLAPIGLWKLRRARLVAAASPTTRLLAPASQDSVATPQQAES